MNKKVKFIFVGGCPRSGTTLVQKLLISHSKVQGGREFGYSIDIFKLYKRMKDEFYLDIPPLRGAFYHTTKEKLVNQYKSFYESFFENKEAVYYSEKTPQNIFVADLLLEVFPDALFINVVRDGRDVGVSFLDVREKLYKSTGQKISHMSIKGTASKWNTAIDKYLNVLSTPNFSHRVFTVRFEELLNDPRQILSSLFKFLQLELEEELLRTEKTLENVYKSKVINNAWYTKEMASQNFITSRIGRWKKDLNFSNKLLVNVLMATNLKKLGYELNPLYLKLQHLRM